MATPGGLVDKQELIDAQLDTAHLGRVVNSKDASGAPINTSTNRTGGVNKTLDALEAEYQSDIDNFVQVSDQVITDKTAEFNEAITDANVAFDDQRDQFETTFNAQFTYKRIGNISDYAGQSLPEADKLNSYQYPDDSDAWYAPVQGQSFPITIPADPTVSGSGWVLTASPNIYRGLWPDTGGSANKGETYQTQTGGTPTGQYFTALQNTTVDPVSDDVNWREVVSVATLPNYTDIVYRTLDDIDPSILKVGDWVRISDIDYVVSLSGISIGSGLFLKPQKESNASDSNTLTDALTGERFRPALNIRTMPLSDAFKDIMVRSASGFNPRIVCYGDSNTRYYQAESSGNKTGPLCNAYGSQLDILCSKYPFLYGASVQTLGFPGERIQYGIDNFNLINPLTDFLVLGWGTNDIKLNNASMESYIESVIELFEKCVDAEICPIMLGIPWFSESYGDQGLLTQNRLKTWNASLYALCVECGVPFIDTYNLTRSRTDFYFNETTTKRHYSVAATKQIAQKLVDTLSSLISSSGESLSSYRNSFHDASSITISNNTLIEREIISLGATGSNQTQSFEVMKVRPFKATKFNGVGRFCLSVYVSEACEFDLTYNGITQRINLSPQVDNGCNYPIVRLSDTDGLNFGSSVGVTITPYSGNVFVRSISFEDGESNTEVFSNSFESVDTGNDLPIAAPQSRSIFVKSLLKTVRYVSDQDAWFDDSGLIAVGTTTQRDDQSNFGAPNGFKFFSTTDSNRYRWDLNTLSWVVF